MKRSLRQKILVTCLPLVALLIIGVVLFISISSPPEASLTPFFLRAMAAVMVVSTLGLMALSIIKITAPILKLKKEIALFSTNDLDLTLPTATEDEIAYLQQAFEQLCQKLSTNRQAHQETQERLNKYEQALEHQVTLRTAELQQANDDLRKAQQKALAAVKAKSTFLANMSHEIRTPMNGVIASAELALGEEVSPGARRYLDIIHSSGYSLVGIINDILDFSKIEAGKMALEMKTFKLDELLKNVSDLFSHKSAQNGTEVLIDIAPDTQLLLVGDPLRVRQIIINLLSNAVKFTVDGIITISVETLAVNHATGYVNLKFKVKDTGQGIHPNQLENLFHPFTQTDSSIARKYGGTGLGLTITKQLVEMMDGRIEVESEYGQGTCFQFNLNLRYERRRTLKTELVLPPSMSGLKILVVDDNPESQNILKRVLNAFDFEATLISSGTDVLNQLQGDGHYDLLITDWMMPEMDGIELCKRIRQDLHLNIPIIMLTAFGKREEEQEAKACQVNQFLFKPIHPPLLFDAIMEAMGKPELKTRKIERRRTRLDFRDHLKGKEVLLVEDNQTNREIAIAILHNVEMTVEIATNGKEALEAVLTRTTRPFDAVLMDIQMPEMDGYETTRHIRRDPRFVSLPIIAMTAYAMTGDEEKCLDAGMNGYVPKPIEQKVLLETLAQFIKAPQNPAFVIKKETPGPKAVAVTLALPIRLPGIDIKSAMDTLGIDSTTFRKIVIGFMQNNLDTQKKLTALFEQKAWPDLAKLSHSLKGSAANIGAKRVEQTS